ncbi:MAG: radical SAM family heme chaperone HemW [Alphaproteobacteria bacterium]|nr:radical SAM family heme chaperone HemW [Alphaproteobacteria bacterium]
MPNLAIGTGSGLSSRDISSIQSNVPAHPSRPVAIYIHFPYCLSKCPYCDFNSHVRTDLDFIAVGTGREKPLAAARLTEKIWQESVILSLNRQMKRLGYDIDSYKNFTIGSIFFGGGTPSLIDPNCVAAILARVKSQFPLSETCEITLEANPNSAESQRFQQFRQAGINRLSLGVQSLNEAALRFLGRGHNVAEAKRAIAAAADNFERFSFDLIYARPEQSITDWRRELTEALQFGASHLSLYQLTIEENTKFFQAHARGDFKIPEDNTAGKFYEITQHIMEQAGLPAYEISNHARPGHESQHNLCYWRYGDYLGLGPGAHGRMTDQIGQKYALTQAKLPETWQKMIAAGGDGLSDVTELSTQDRFAESLMMGLRLTEGIALTLLSKEGGLSTEQIENWLESKKCQNLIDGNFIEITGDRLTATASGRQRLNAVLRELLAVEIC